MIGENIRSYRKKNGLTQEEFAERLGVTYQSVSRWENGATYPDLELIPSISELLGVTIDGLLGMPMRERERRASESFDALRRECMKRNYDTKRISELLREIRRYQVPGLRVELSTMKSAFFFSRFFCALASSSLVSRAKATIR